VQIINDTLQALGAAGPFPKWEVFAERLPVEARTDNVLLSFQYTLGIRGSEGPVADIRWLQNVFNDAS
jgi:hypothetical protein